MQATCRIAVIKSSTYMKSRVWLPSPRTSIRRGFSSNFLTRSKTICFRSLGPNGENMRTEAPRKPYSLQKTFKYLSAASFDTPYGDMGKVRASSLIGSEIGLPYTAADE